VQAVPSTAAGSARGAAAGRPLAVAPSSKLGAFLTGAHGPAPTRGNAYADESPPIGGSGDESGDEAREAMVSVASSIPVRTLERDFARVDARLDRQATGRALEAATGHTAGHLTDLRRVGPSLDRPGPDYELGPRPCPLK
jgi:hypothetical protein